MDISFVRDFASDAQIRTVCWMLVHSLWVGLMTAGLAGVVLMFTHKASSRLRYQLLAGCLLVFVLITGFMFYRESEVSVAAQGQSLSGSFENFAHLVSTDLMSISGTWNFLDLLILFVNQNALWIFSIWLAFFVLKSLRLISGLFYIHRIRTRSTHAVSEEWMEKLKDFSVKLGINQSVVLLQSELVKIPVTVGHLKPVILIPLGLLVQLPYEQVETILLHELAHIKRRDYLVNLFQGVLETLFFFNPGLLWLSALIREERETCCDDIVLAHTSVKRNYLEALLAFHAPSTQSELVLGLGDNQLLNRLKRIINHENKRLNIMEKIVLLAGLLMVSAFSYMPKVGQPLKAAVSVELNRKKVNQVVSQGDRKVALQDFHDLKEVPEKSFKTLDTNGIPVKTRTGRAWKFQRFQIIQMNEDTANADIQGTDYYNDKYEAKVESNKVVSLKINGVQLSENEFTHYLDLFEVMEDMWHETKNSRKEARARMREKENTPEGFVNKKLGREFKLKDSDFSKFELKIPNGGSSKKYKIENDEKSDLK